MLIICCINKKDLYSDVENEDTIRDFKVKNDKLKDQPIILVSAKNSDGIKELKDKIVEYSLNIINPKKQDSNTSTEIRSHSFPLVNQPIKKRKCCK